MMAVAGEPVHPPSSVVISVFRLGRGPAQDHEEAHLTVREEDNDDLIWEGKKERKTEN
jgi:hypothetical protein